MDIQESKIVPGREELALKQLPGDWAVLRYPTIGTVLIVALQTVHPMRVRFSYDDVDTIRLKDYDRERWLKIINSKYLLECGRVGTQHEAEQYASGNS